MGLTSYTLRSSDGAFRPCVFQRLRVIAALHRAVRAVGEDERAAEGVAAVARNDVEDHAGRLRFAQAAGGGEHHFLRAGHVPGIFPPPPLPPAHPVLMPSA